MSLDSILDTSKEISYNVYQEYKINETKVQTKYGDLIGLILATEVMGFALNYFYMSLSQYLK